MQSLILLNNGSHEDQTQTSKVLYCWFEDASCETIANLLKSIFEMVAKEESKEAVDMFNNMFWHRMDESSEKLQLALEENGFYESALEKLPIDCEYCFNKFESFLEESSEDYFRYYAYKTEFIPNKSICAVASGDCECFCFDISEQDYEKLDPKDYAMEKEAREPEEGSDDCEQVDERFRVAKQDSTAWQLYPNHILRLAGIGKDVEIMISNKMVIFREKDG